MGSIYCANMYCDECTEKIKEDHAKDGFVPDDPDNQYTYDSDEYPKDCDVTCEADCPQHCAGCHVFLENDLTCDGADYVVEAVRDDIASGHHDSIALTEWMPFYDWIEYGANGKCDECGAWTNELEDYGCSGCNVESDEAAIISDFLEQHGWSDFVKSVARSACLDQRIGDDCICFSCKANKLLRGQDD